MITPPQIPKYLLLPMASLAALIAPLAVAPAAVLTFQQGAAIPALGISSYAGTSDTTLISGASAGLNYGGANSLYMGKSASVASERESLLMFDLSSLAGTTDIINSVTLTMTFVNNTPGSNAANVGINLYQIQTANGGWLPGTANAVAQTGAASWNYKATTTSSWAGSAGLSTAGTDYVGTVLDGTKTVDTTSSLGTKYTWTLPTSLIDSWISGSNTGLLFAPSDYSSLATGDYFRFASSEYTTQSFRPTLTINYTVPEPGSTALFLIGTGVLVLRGLVRTRKQA